MFRWLPKNYAKNTSALYGGGGGGGGDGALSSFLRAPLSRMSIWGTLANTHSEKIRKQFEAQA